MTVDNTEAVKIKNKEGHEALVLRESVEAYKALGWTELKNTEIPEYKDGVEGQPAPSQLIAALPDKSEKK